MNQATSTQEKSAILETAREFAVKEARKVGKAMDVDPNPKFPHELVRKGCELGFNLMHVPQRYGGLEIDHTTGGLVIQEFSYGEASLACIFHVSQFVALTIEKLGTAEQRDKWLPRFSDPEPFVGAFCLTEPESGSDLMAQDPRIGAKTSAVLDGGHYVINGNKRFITNGTAAKLYLVVARIDPEKTLWDGGIGIFIVPRETPGVSVGKKEDKMGQRMSDTCDMLFEEVRVPKNYFLGEGPVLIDNFLPIFLTSLSYVGMISIGIARAAYEEAREYAKNRQQGGKILIEHQAIATIISEMFAGIEAAQALTLKALASIDTGMPDARLCSAAKWFSSDMAMAVTTKAVSVFGGYGYMKDYPVEKLMRDAKVTQIYEGANEVHKNLPAMFPFIF